MATDKHNLIVYCEYEDGKVADVSLELLTKGRQLADRLGIKLEAVVAGDNLKEIEKQILPFGVDTLYKFEDKRLYPYTSLPHASLLINLFKEKEPRIAFMGATSIGRDLGPRVSSSLHSGLTADCTSLEIGDHTDARSGEEYKDLLLQIRPAFGGNIVATIVNPECRPQMATVREGVMKKEVKDSNYTGKIVDLKADDYTSPEDYVVEVIDRHVEKAKHNLKGSPIVVAGHDRQIGQTGLTVRPKLYIACGISGQIQHIAGMQDSSIIISVNNDPDAPINAIADYVITGNVEDVVPRLIKYYKKNTK